MDDLSKVLEISSMTIYRDIKEEDQIILSKGNLILNNISEEFENPFTIRKNENKEEKEEIIKNAIKYIKNYDTIFLDGSTTISYLGEELKKINLDLTIVTISPIIAIELASCSKFRIFCPGGWLDRINFIFSKDMIEVFNSININKAFISCGGFSLSNGFTDTSIGETQIKKNVLEKGIEINILADSSKYNRVNPHTWARFSDINRLFIDKNVSNEDLKVLKNNISEVI